MWVRASGRRTVIPADLRHNGTYLQWLRDSEPQADVRPVWILDHHAPHLGMLSVDPYAVYVAAAQTQLFGSRHRQSDMFDKG